ncbi:MAG TPA: ATP-binding protein [Candidatus Limnocylindria bacterium]|nr:ATP-binding protein [Candidatus Limnocylindria bacterium]
MPPARPPALAASVVPLPAAPSGLETELLLHVPSDVDRVGEAVDIVAGQVENRFTDPRTVRFNLRVALGEALANAILYGTRSDPSKQVGVRVRFGRTAIEMEVNDDGEGFDPGNVPDPTTPEHISAASGRGIFLIRKLVDEVHYNEKGNTICMTLRRA